MGWTVLLLAAAAASWHLYGRYWKAPPPPPPAPVAAPAPPPAAPLPLVSQKELARLRKAAKDGTAAERSVNYRALMVARDPNVAVLLSGVISNDGDPEMRLKAVSLLFDTGDKNVMLAGFLRALKDDDAAVRLEALRYIEKLGDPAAAPRVAEAAGDDIEPEVKTTALRVLGTLHEKAAQAAEARAAKAREEYENAVKERQKKEGR